MADARSPTSASSGTTGKRGASGATKPARAPKAGHAAAAKATAAPVRRPRTMVRKTTTDPYVAVTERTPAAIVTAANKAAALGNLATMDKIMSYIEVYRATPLERIDMIRRGILASEAKRIFADLPIGQGAGFKALNLSVATVNKKAKHGETLSPEESERVVGFAKLVGQLEAMIQESGDPTSFDARAWMARWLAEPLPAFGGVRPADLVDTMEGQNLVSAALAKIQSGAYA
jgi:putative toxin-antitoxin system antitoxin component (TIGR02293 family)